uniref:Multiple inositol polyphosphate phosphatase 1 n=1 Tax=Globisporangium ultimum (strain ATCC 200006 / CBS 805.95 / DAOM BR144) TaxID=431595 RepID=K3WU62_GLOUD
MQSDETTPLLSQPRSASRKASRTPSARFWQLTALLLGTVLITTLLWEMTPDVLHSSEKPKPPVHVKRDPKYPFARFFATKTAYWDQRDGSESNQELLTKYENALLREDLQLRQTHLIVRHGVRYPTGTNIEALEALVAKLQQFQELIPSWLVNYSMPYNLSVEGELAAAGVQEMEDLARRMVRSTGHMDPVTYVKSKSRVAHTYSSRTKKSAEAYASKFFANPEDVKYIEYPKGHDPLLRFFDSCPKYQREVKQNQSALNEKHAFERSEFMVNNTRALKQALGLETASGVNITTTDVEAAFSACAFDYALSGTTTKWCTLMTETFIVSMDYLDDLQAFYDLGAGYPINYEMSAVLLQYVVGTMKGRIDETNNLHNVLHFAHAETTLPLMTLLGYTERAPLRANASLADIEGRNFRTSVFAPFGANIEFRLFQRKSNDAQYFVQVLVNEQENEIPGCGDVYCDLVKLERLWHDYLANMDFDAMCQ